MMKITGGIFGVLQLYGLFTALKNLDAKFMRICLLTSIHYSQLDLTDLTMLDKPVQAKLPYNWLTNCC